MSIVVISPKVAEDSAGVLAEKLKADYINPYQADKRDFREYDVVFNYGFSRDIKGKTVINSPEGVRVSRDKIKCLSSLNDKCHTIKFTEDRKEAEKWIGSGHTVVARELVKADNGKGLHYCNTKEELDKVEAKFWTRYIHHLGELRVNVWKGKVLSVYSKEEEGGFFAFYPVEGQEEQPQLLHMVDKVYEITKLDWFGMDVLLTDKGTLFFLEVNSAPVLFGEDCKKIVKELTK